VNEAVSVPDVDAAQAARLAEDGAVLLLDVREDDEWDSGHAPQALHTALGALVPADIPGDRPVITVCRSGKRSGEAAKRLAGAGLDVRNLSGGMRSWTEAGLPVVANDGTPGQII
jgi:rhodanese-related sulfurtransferase